MPTQGKLEGTKFLFYVGGTAISHSTSGSIEFSADTRDTTTKDSGNWAEKAVTLLSATGSCEGLVALDATYGMSELFAAYKARNPVTVKFSTEESGDTFFSGSALITSLSEEAPDKDNTTYSCSFDFTGEVSELTNT